MCFVKFSIKIELLNALYIKMDWNWAINFSTLEKFIKIIQFSKFFFIFLLYFSQMTKKQTHFQMQAINVLRKFNNFLELKAKRNHIYNKKIENERNHNVLWFENMRKQQKKKKEKIIYVYNVK